MTRGLAANPPLATRRYVQVFAELAHAAAKEGIVVVLGAHRLSPGAWPGNGLWCAEPAGTSTLEVFAGVTGALVRLHRARQV